MERASAREKSFLFNSESSLLCLRQKHLLTEKVIYFLFLCNFQNGYPSRRRSLVDDARFEAQVVKQNKQANLEEARQQTNGMISMVFRA